MIQELLGSGSGTTTGRGGLLGSADSKMSASPSNSTTTTTTIAVTATPTQNSSENNNQSQLRCPRCDSSNTKFCYYNNYNLTQPRHFCKTCRRYWTKGGALRNVPIGGGCRKNHKTSNSCIGVIASSSLGKPSTGKLKNAISSSNIVGKSPSFLTGYDHELLSSNPNILWASPQSSHNLLALLRSTQNPNPTNTMLNSINHVKEEGVFLGSHMMMMSPDQPNGNGVLNARPGSLALDPSIGLCNNSLWRNNNQIHGDQQQLHHQLQQNSYANHNILGDPQNNGGILDHQKLSLMRSSTTLPNYNYPGHSSPVVLGGNVMSCGSSTSNSSGILESAAVGSGGEHLAAHHHHHNNSYWNIIPSLSWSDLPTTTNGAYP